MRIRTSKSESMVLTRKKVECLLRVGEEVQSQVEEFKYLGILFTSEEGAEPESKALDLPVDLRPSPHLWPSRWVMTERTRSWIQAAEMSFLHRVAGLILRDRGDPPADGQLGKERGEERIEEKRRGEERREEGEGEGEGRRGEERRGQGVRPAEADTHQVESALRQMSEHMQRITAGVSQLSGQLVALDERLPRTPDTAMSVPADSLPTNPAPQQREPYIPIPG
ncbi:hypothetical protein D4764_04G0010260, partial [Takifugu flavidus]